MDAIGAEMLTRAMAETAANPAAFPVVLIGDAGLMSDPGQAVEAVGGRVVAQMDWPAFIAGQGPTATGAVFACEAQGVAGDLLDAALSRVDATLQALGASVVFNFDRLSLDQVATELMDKPVQLLCEPTQSEWALALVLAAQSRGRPVPCDSTTYEGEAERLKRLNEEVARIADVLARLTRRDASEPRRPLDVPDRGPAFTGPVPDLTIDPAEIRRAIRGRRMRDQFFGGGLFEEPGWDMMLDLFAAELERSRVSVSSLCIAAAVAPTTALRWISKLTEAGLFERQPDPFDRRRAFMELSERASRSMREYVAALRRAGLSLA